MPVTVKYKDGTARAFASEEDALLQAAHDLSHPNGVDPNFIVDGDQTQVHTQWTLDGLPDNVKLLHDAKATSKLKCECVDCEFGRRSAGFGIDRGADKAKLYQEIYRERVIDAK